MDHTGGACLYYFTFASHAHIERGGGAGHFLNAHLAAPVVVQEERGREGEEERVGKCVCLLQELVCASPSPEAGTRRPAFSNPTALARMSPLTLSDWPSLGCILHTLRQEKAKRSWTDKRKEGGRRREGRGGRGGRGGHGPTRKGLRVSDHARATA